LDKTKAIGARELFSAARKLGTPGQTIGRHNRRAMA